MTEAMLADLEDFIRSVSDAAGEEAPKFRRSDLAEHLTAFLDQVEDGDAEFAFGLPTPYEEGKHPRGYGGKWVDKPGGEPVSAPRPAQPSSPVPDKVRQAVHAYLRENGSATRGELVEHLSDEGISRRKAPALLDAMLRAGQLRQGPDDYGNKDAYHLPAATSESVHQAVRDFIQENGPATHQELVEHLYEHDIPREQSPHLIEALAQSGALRQGPDEYGRENAYHLADTGAPPQAVSPRQVAPVPSAAPTPPPAVASTALAAASTLPLFHEALAKAEPRIREQMGKAVEVVSQRLSGRARERIQQNMRSVAFHDNCLEMARTLKQTVPELATAAQQADAQSAGGCYVGGKYQQLHLVSGYLGFGSGTLKSDLLKAGEDMDSHVLAHELGHVLDGPTQEYSRSWGWTHAWAQEIGKPGFLGLGRAKSAPLTEYARTTTQEGFAEFSRLVYASNVSREQIEKQFPRCVAFWKERGLWE